MGTPRLISPRCTFGQSLVENRSSYHLAKHKGARPAENRTSLLRPRLITPFQAFLFLGYRSLTAECCDPQLPAPLAKKDRGVQFQNLGPLTFRTAKLPIELQQKR
jgi:hypothetical protein